MEMTVENSIRFTNDCLRPNANSMIFTITDTRFSAEDNYKDESRIFHIMQRMGLTVGTFPVQLDDGSTIRIFCVLGLQHISPSYKTDEWSRKLASAIFHYYDPCKLLYKSKGKEIEDFATGETLQEQTSDSVIDFMAGTKDWNMSEVGSYKYISDLNMRTGYKLNWAMAAISDYGDGVIQYYIDKK